MKRTSRRSITFPTRPRLPASESENGPEAGIRTPTSQQVAAQSPTIEQKSTGSTHEDSAVLEALLASAPVGVVFLDGGLRVARMNTALADVVGLPVSKCIGCHARDVIPSLWPVIGPALQRVAESGESISEFEFSGTDAGRSDARHWIASLFPVWADGQRLEGVGAVVRDVTARKRVVEQESRRTRQRERFYALADALVAASTSRDVVAAVVEHGAAAMGADGCVVAMRTADGQFIDLLGAHGMPPDVAEEWRRFAVTAPTPLSLVTRTGEPLFLESAEDWQNHFPALARLAEGVGHQANAVIPILIDGDSTGALGLAFGGARTFSEEERALAIHLARQCALALERARLLEAEHLARTEADAANQVKTQFLATMSHELRTPLNAIGGYAELLEMGIHGPITEGQRDVLGRIQRSQNHLLSLINNVLNLVKLDTNHARFELTTVSVAAALQFVSEATVPQMQSKRLHYDAHHCASDLAVRADAEKLRQILLNLLSNAIKFTEEGGAISIRCSSDVRTVRLHVRDTGVGIPSDQHDNIFEPFVQVDRRLNRPMEGTGLGLAISRELARGMGGELTVESRPGAGSTFTLALPRASTE